MNLWKMVTPEKYSPLKNSHPWKIVTPEKYSPLKNIYPLKIFTPEKYTPLKNTHCVHHVGVHHVGDHHVGVFVFVFVFVITRRQPISHFKSLNSLLLINTAYIGSWKHFVSVFVCVSLSLYLSFCKYSSWPLSSPDDKLSENMVCRTSYSGDKWRCYHGDGRTNK